MRKTKIEKPEPGTVDADLEDLYPHKLLFLIQQVFDCIQDEQGKSPQTTILCDTIMMFEFDEYKYRIQIEPIQRYN